MLDRLTESSPVVCLRLNSGILLPSALFTRLSLSGNRNTRGSVESMHDARLDGEDTLDEIRPRLDLDWPRPRNIDIVNGGDPARPCRHHRNAVGEKDRLGDRMGNESDGLARFHPDFL